ncbi:hypothetical protein D0864_04504 [Hortaea werneckii]|uniref:Uncharacterized protein n=1 Tax=Hortaea werneckii TaxID=91943 RepID=A0A3M7GBI0_HORWE|nr:WD40 repeat-like protein [Hortaea werneckii]KAI7567373.1 WD40 repeat-like protein [Hortaea werneckii]KAI7675551.1 WD40 repeat-like protein [Hortaea werneckii]RMY98106.1 hypothetical protein D0864_04504 [Hortaea werneckii]
MAPTRGDRSPAASRATESETSGDDDMDFELAESTPSGVSDDMDEEEDAGNTTLYFDAEEGVLRDEDGDEVTFGEDGDEVEEEIIDEDDEGNRTPQPEQSEEQTQRPHHITVTQQQILQLLSNAGLQGIFRPTSGITTRSQARRGNAGHVALEDDGEEEEEEDEDDDLGSYLGYGARRRRHRRAFTGDRYPKIPSEEGKKLMASGIFGNNDRCNHTACGEPLSESTLRKRRKLHHRMLDRELGIGNQTRSNVLGKLAAQNLVPSSKADLIVNLNARCYSGQFSEDGSFFFACGQDFKVRMYDTSNPYDWKYYKTVHYYGGQWTITDASLSPDNRNLAYSSIRSQVCLANTEQGDDSEPQMLDFSDLGRGGRGHGGGGWGRSHGHFGIWSLRFSGDGGEIVAGTSDSSVYVYDLEAQRSILRIPGHQDDVNAVCFGDKMSPHILYSGSDDTTVKVWDRRSLASMRPAGMFLGHTEGVTYIDSKGDGRYVISNGKDQTCKLWDLRKMISTDVGERINPQDYTTNFDYRFSPYDTEDHVPHQHDCSLVTFRGHRVLKTLIRCHFSPPGSTDGRYIYSGSHDGKIYVWNLDGTQASEPINVLAATKNSRPADDERFVDRYDYYGRGGVWKTIVRDCSWHPSAPVIAATSWNGWDHGLGTATVHSWNDGLDSDEVGGDTDGFTGARAETMGKANSLGSTPMGARVTAQLNHDDRYYGEGNTSSRPSTRSRGMRARMMGLGGLFADDEDDDE